MNTSERIKKIYRLLHDEYGPQGWWPGESRLECIIGAILTQNTSWSNVEKAIGNLKKLNLISVNKLNLLTTQELAELIRPSGYYNQKAIKIKSFLGFLNTCYEDNLDKMFDEEVNFLRNRLLEIKGIGPETADCILLYGGNKPIFVVDTYTYRILSRHGLVPENTNYNEIQEIFMDSLEISPEIFNEYHALLVKAGKEHCKRSKPICAGCPLESDPHTV
jgi:endonuclease-3 related protein